MTISSDVNSSGPYNGNGVTTVFPYDFKILAETHIAVFLYRLDGQTVEMSLDNGDYSVSGVGSDDFGSVTLQFAPVLGEKVTLLLLPPYTQESSFGNNSAYLAESVEKRFDLTVQQILSLKAVTDRSIKVDPGQPVPSVPDIAAAQKYAVDAADARDAALAAANNQMVFDTAAAAAAATIPVFTRFIRLNGGSIPGDGYGGLFSDTDNGGAVAFSTSGGTARNWYRVRDVDPVRLTGVDNYSMPLALNIQFMYVKATGSNVTGGDVTHGFSEAKAFQTSDAALLHAKKYARFNGRLNAIYLKFDNGAVRSFNLGSNLQQGDDYFPFVIGITSIDNANRAQFDSITCGSWMHTSVYVTQVDFAYATITRLNLMRINNVGIRAMRDGSGNVVNLAYCLYAAFGAYLHLFGDIRIKEAVTYTSAFLYCQQHGALMLENGDTPSIFPLVVLTNAGNITSPYLYRAVLGGRVYAASNVYPQLTYAGNFWVDAYSFSTQTQAGTDLGKNAAPGGPIVVDVGNTAAGYFIRADGYCEQWGTVTLTGLAVGRTNVAATIVFDKELISVSYFVEGSTNNLDVRVGLHGTPLATGFPLGAWNQGAAGGAATARWRVCGYVV